MLPGAPLIGTAVELRRDFLGTALRAAREVGDVARIDAGPPGWRTTFYSVSAPELAAEVLGQPDRYTRDTRSYAVLRWAFGNGMLTSQGETWRRQRRLLAPIFTRRRIETSYAAIMAEEAANLVQRWRSAEAGGRTVDAHAEMVTLTSLVIGRILFGADVADAVPRLMQSRSVGDGLIRRGLSPHALPIQLPTPANRRLRAGVANLRRIVADIIAERRAAGSRESDADMLGLLLHAQESAVPEERLTDTEVADQVLVFLLAGHDTTASTLACLLVELALAAEWQERIRSEVRQLPNGRPATADEVARLPWTGRAVQEAMRLYPAAHSIGRRARDAEVLGGHHLPAGATVVVSPWSIHRSPKHWTNPEVFDPGRFAVPAGEFPGGHRYAWLPFGAGPHTCIGMQIAMLEAPIILATILSEFSLRTCLSTVPVRAAISLHPARDLPVQLEPA